MAERLILDAGPVIGYARSDKRIAAYIKQAHALKIQILVPPAVITQTLRGGGQDAAIYRLLAGCNIPALNFEVARLAGYLLGETGTSDVVDAQIAAQAISAAPCNLLTGDEADMRLLVQGHPGVRVRGI